MLLQLGDPGLWTLPIIGGCNSTSLSDEKARKQITSLQGREKCICLLCPFSLPLSVPRT